VSRLRVANPGLTAFLPIAAEALSRYKLRTALSVLGVVLGVAAVIAMMSVSEGARREALTQVDAMGLDNLVARKRVLTADQAAQSSGLTAADADRVMHLVPLTKVASPLVERFSPVSNAGRRRMTRIVGVNASYQAILRLELQRGRFFSVADERNVTRVAVLGSALAGVLFGYDNPVGQRVRVEDQYFDVIGVLAPHGAGAGTPGALAWRDIDQSVIAPLPAVVGRRLDVAPELAIDELWLQTSDGEQVEEIGRVLEHTLAQLHGREDVDIVVPRELLNQRYRTQRTFSVVVGSVAALALIVGGIGIMNIMLTSVVERTHEIGIRRTVGATRQDVAVQFLTEALLMTLSGGIIGIVLGVIVSWGITAYAGWQTHISVTAVMLACTVSLAVGLGFGLYPAIRAARLEPVDAVRYE
jgi:putative ABC transport system permease protein